MLRLGKFKPRGLSFDPAGFIFRGPRRLRIVRGGKRAAFREEPMSNFDRNAAPWSRGYARTGADVDQGLRAFMLGVYNHMSIGLALTGLFALGVNMLAVSGVPTQFQLGSHTYLTSFGAAIYTSPLRWVIMFAPLAFVLFFSFKINSMSASSARGLFYAYAAVMGVSLSSILLIYTGASVTRAFFITAASFGALSLYGYTTKRSLSGMGSFLMMGLFGLIIASLVNLFVQSSAFQFGLSILTVLIFAGLTAYDTQSIKQMYLESDGYEDTTKKSINGALMLYLDFINIFMALVQLTGDRRS
jgi:FtsH-binding integral membrane protein